MGLINDFPPVCYRGLTSFLNRLHRATKWRGGGLVRPGSSTDRDSPVAHPWGSQSALVNLSALNGERATPGSPPPPWGKASKVSRPAPQPSPANPNVRPESQTAAAPRAH